MSSLRSKETISAYNEYKIQGGLASGSCPLCDKVSIIEFENWRVIKNEFPYDLIASVHDMIVPKQHIKEESLTLVMHQELIKIKSGYLNENYTHIIEALPKSKSIPEHFHLHLIKEKL